MTQNLLPYWQRNNIWLTKSSALTWNLSDDLDRDIALLIDRGVQIASEDRKEIQHFRLKCTCKIVGGQDVTGGCWLHDWNLKIK